MSFTVTATGAGGTPYANSSLTLLVLTGATEAGGTGAGAELTPPAAMSIIPVFNNSLICWALENETNSTLFTAASNNTSLNSAADSVGASHMQGYYSGAVASGSPVVVGSSAPTSNIIAAAAAYEVKPSGASAPARDASAPAPVNSNASSATTAAFTPPAGAVLAALVSTPGAPNAGYAVTMSDTSGLGLTWTLRAVQNGGVNQGYAGVFTATVPGGLPAPEIGQVASWRNLSALENNDPSYDFALVSSGVPFDLTNYTVKLFLKASQTALDSTATVYTVGSGLAVTNAHLGQVTWSPPHAGLGTPGSQWYHLDAIDGNGKDTTFFLGNFTIFAV